MRKPKSKLHIYNMKQAKIGKPNILSQKPILQYDLHNNLIEEYSSYTLAKKITKINGINNVLVGKTRTAGGFIWKHK
jgi:hypothetical protein